MASKGRKSLPTLKHALVDFDLVVHVSFVSRVQLESSLTVEPKNAKTSRLTASGVYLNLTDLHLPDKDLM